MKKVLFGFVLVLFLCLFLGGCSNNKYQNTEFFKITYTTNDKEVSEKIKNGNFGKDEFLKEFDIDNVSYIIYDKESFTEYSSNTYYAYYGDIYIFLDKKTDKEFEKMINYFLNDKKRDQRLTIFNNKDIEIKGDKYE